MKDFIDIYNAHNQQVRSILFRYCSNNESIDDMVQETFIKIWRSLDKFEQKSSLRTWVYRITVNAAIDYQRKNKKHSTHLELENHNEPEALENTNAQLMNQQLVEMAINALSEEHKSVAILSLYQQLSNQEVADVLEIAVGTVKSRLYNAKKQMQEKLKAHGVELIDVGGV